MDALRVTIEFACRTAQNMTKNVKDLKHALFIPGRLVPSSPPLPTGMLDPLLLKEMLHALLLA